MGMRSFVDHFILISFLDNSGKARLLSVEHARQPI